MKNNGIADRIKSNGIHYTPPALAQFLARSVVRNLPAGNHTIHVVDPACGDGALLHAFAMAVPPNVRKRVMLTGYELDAVALAQAASLLEGCGAAGVVLKADDFLSLAHDKQQRLVFDDSERAPLFDCVIANPPYVRTQVLGAKTAQSLARRFGLTGRVDLYHAFAFAMGSVLKSGGILGLLTSNRFLTTNAGETLRRMLRTEFRILELYDLGDTKLFSAAVLPAIVVAAKGGSANGDCHFARVYESRNGNEAAHECSHILDAMTNSSTHGLVRTPQGVFLVEKGTLAAQDDTGEKWSLSTPALDKWLHTVRKHQFGFFEDIASIRVGIKTTADKVFVRSDWESLSDCPEDELLHPLITHRNAERWRITWTGEQRRVLYPYNRKLPRKKPVPLKEYPKARKYLCSHEERLRSRKYVLEAGREWYEIWVPQLPSDWAKPKVVFPDISELPKFSLDRSGAIVQGDCYWITLKEGVDPAWLMVMLAVANSTFGVKYYDVAFHNKLYAGRRRFMTQYVKRFPLPNLNEKELSKLSSLVESLVQSQGDSRVIETKCNQLVWKAFGLVKESGG